MFVLHVILPHEKWYRKRWMCLLCSFSFIKRLDSADVDWTVRDIYTLGEEFTYVALVQKADKKSKRLKFDIGNHLCICAPVQILTQSVWVLSQ
jgi:hypothetical protein